MQIILLVEDNDSLRELIHHALSPNYNILVACNGREALALFRHYSDEIKLLLVDAGLPDFNGWELAAIFDGVRPKIKCLLMSGDVDLRSTSPHQPSRWWFILKPFSLSELGNSVSQVLSVPELEGSPESDLSRYLGANSPTENIAPPKSPGTVPLPISRRATSKG